LLGIIASSVYTEPLLDQRAANYNKRVAAGTVFDEEGFPVSQPVEMFELKIDQPKLVNDRWMVTYEGYNVSNSPRPGQQSYRVKFEPVDGGNSFYMDPVVYPMLTTSSSSSVEWSVDPHVRTGIFEDVYFYVAGSKYVEKENERVAEQSQQMMPVSGSEQAESDSVQTVEIAKGEVIEAGDFSLQFIDFRPATEEQLPENTQVGIRALIRMEHVPSGSAYEVEPLFAVYTENERSYTYSPPLTIDAWDMDLQFTRLLPESESIEVSLDGPIADFEEDWVLVVAEIKPFVSVVWLGTFLLMAGFSVSIFRHWSREKQAKEDYEDDEKF
jgi:cytochrome c-type biogenesis protein CcmF